MVLAVTAVRFAQVWVQELGQGRLAPEFASIERAASRRGLPCRRFLAKQLLRRRVPLGGDALVAGDLPSMHAAMQQLGVDRPAPDDYPEVLRPWLGRRVWRTTLGHALERAQTDPVFVKPAGSLKRFPGFVAGRGLGVDASPSTDVWCSEVVSWVSEFRTFVVQGAVVGQRPYRAGVAPDPAVVQAAVAAVGCDRAAYAIDFGVAADGRTLLVERNDGYGIGSYGLDDDPYFDVLATRWAELLER